MPLAGAISSLGVFALLISGVIGVFVSFHVSQDQSLLRKVGLFNLFLACDDFYMLHDSFLPLVLGISQLYLFALYGLLCLAIVYRYGRSLTGIEHIGLYISIALLGLSILLDIFVRYSENQVVVEDSFKFCGLILWLTYWVKRSHLTLRHATRTAARRIITVPSQ